MALLTGGPFLQTVATWLLEITQSLAFYGTSFLGSQCHAFEMTILLFWQAGFNAYMKLALYLLNKASNDAN